MYAAHAIPAAMQFGDAWIGWQRREWDMVIAPLCAAFFHLATGICFL
ncbi:hypothetical protein [Neisseria sp.]|nr:hypothetical protein [Neisseria sp.]MDO4906631.1 hypothetical protein [Neisseria sp.]